MDNKKRFDDFEEIDCNTCDHYWNSTCDAVSVGEKKPCASFLATRRADVKEELESLKDEIVVLKLSLGGILIYILVDIVIKLIRSIG